MQDVGTQKIRAPILKPYNICHACSGNFHLLAVLTSFKLRFFHCISCLYIIVNVTSGGEIIY